MGMQEDLENAGEDAREAAAKKGAKGKRTVRNPAKYVAMREMTLAVLMELSADAKDSSQVVFVPATAQTFKGPDIARKAIIADKIGGKIRCFRGPVWAETFGVQEVFGVVEE